MQQKLSGSGDFQPSVTACISMHDGLKWSLNDPDQEVMIQYAGKYRIVRKNRNQAETAKTV